MQHKRQPFIKMYEGGTSLLQNELYRLIKLTRLYGDSHFLNHPTAARINLIAATIKFYNLLMPAKKFDKTVPSLFIHDALAVKKLLGCVVVLKLWL
jgi:hypothetical protein